MVGARLLEVMQAGAGVGECTGQGVRTGVASHPVCGDEVQLSVRLGAGRLLELRWRAHGCPATVAVAALAAKVLVGVPIADASTRLAQAIVEHGGLAAAERHAEAMVSRALAAALPEAP
jgi:NifU-like protein involved in Fe-S cluster formation